MRAAAGFSPIDDDVEELLADCLAAALLSATGTQIDDSVSLAEEECVTVTEPGDWAMVFNVGRGFGTPGNFGYTSTASSPSIACGADVTGSLFCMGLRANRAVGTGTATGTQTTPFHVPINGSVTKVVAGKAHVCALTAEQTIWCWGVSVNDQLGTAVPGQSTANGVPRQVFGGHDWIDVEAGADRSCAINTNHEMYCWGYRYLYGTTVWSTKSRTLIAPRFPDAPAEGRTWLSLSIGRETTCAVANDGTYCWGQNTQFQTGTTTPDRAPITRLTGDNTFVEVKVTHDGFGTCGITDGNEIYCWGIQTTIPGVSEKSATPVLVQLPAGAGEVRTLETVNGNTMCAVADGGVYCWGQSPFTTATTIWDEPQLVVEGPVGQFSAAQGRVLYLDPHGNMFHVAADGTITPDAFR